MITQKESVVTRQKESGAWYGEHFFEVLPLPGGRNAQHGPSLHDTRSKKWFWKELQGD